MWNTKRIVWLVMMVATMAMIFYFSSQRTDVSGAVSNSVAVSLNIETQHEWQEPSNMPLLFGMTLRKWAHVIIFAVLGLFSVGVFSNFWCSLVFCYFCALFDELHQLFVPGRTASLTDTLIDALGFIPVIMVFGFYRMVLKSRKTY